MGQFSINNGLISRNSSTITGSLNVTGQITASHFGTSSYVITASYSLNSGTASYTATTSVLSASYATTATSASIAQTASIMLNPSYGPTPGIGYISPNICALSALASVSFIVTSSVNLGGTLLFPFMIYKDCTLVTMSMLGGTSGNTTASICIYSNSTSSLPEYLLVTGSIKTNTANANVQLYHSNDFTPIKLYANNIYWTGYTSNATATGVYTWRSAVWPTNTCPSYNPLLGYAIAVSGSGSPANFIYPMWCLKSGSFSTIFAPTASQSTSSYSAPSGTYLSPAVGTSTMTSPYLKVTYP